MKRTNIVSGLLSVFGCGLTIYGIILAVNMKNIPGGIAVTITGIIFISSALLCFFLGKAKQRRISSMITNGDKEYLKVAAIIPPNKFMTGDFIPENVRKLVIQTEIDGETINFESEWYTSEEFTHMGISEHTYIAVYYNKKRPSEYFIDLNDFTNSQP